MKKNIAIAFIALLSYVATCNFGTCGIRPEYDPINIVFLANADDYSPVIDAHKLILQNLPTPTLAVILENPNKILKDPLEKFFPKEFASCRFSFFHHLLEGNWTRDFMGELVRDNRGNRWWTQFLYGNRVESRAASLNISEEANYSRKEINLQIQGGNIMSDSVGRIYISTVALRQNPSFSQQSITKTLAESLDASEIVWLPEQPDESTGHVDMMAKIINKQEVFVADSANFERKRILDLAAKTFESKGFKVIRILNAESNTNNHPVFTYVNSLLVNGTAYVPQYAVKDVFDDATIRKADAAAVMAYKKAGFNVVAIPSFYLSAFGGSIHCITKQYSL